MQEIPLDTLILPTYEEAIQILQCQDQLELPAELHGYLCGILCSRGEFSEELQLKLISADLSDKVSNEAAIKDFMEDLLRTSQYLLASPECLFSPLLPDEESDFPIETRYALLSHWCASFIEGMRLMGFSLTDLSLMEDPDVKESLESLIKISEKEYKLEESEVANEDIYIQVLEYVRVCVMLIYAENVLGPASREGGALH